jgi:hypothetical protein
MLIEAIRDGRDALTVLPPLWVYNPSGGYTAEMQAIFQGRAVPPTVSLCSMEPADQLYGNRNAGVQAPVGKR